MSDPIGGVWAMKNGDFQPANFASTGAGIQAAIDYCGSTGGQVFLGPQDFTITSTITLLPDITLVGCGNRTRISTGSSTTLDALSYTGPNADNIRVMDVGFLHTGGYTGYSINLNDVIDSWIVRCYGRNFKIGPAGSIRIQDTVADGGAFILDTVQDSHLVGCLAYQAPNLSGLGDGFSLTACSDVRFSSCDAVQCYRHGWNLIGSDRVTFTGCTSESSSYGQTGVADNLHIDGTSDGNFWIGGHLGHHGTDGAIAKYNAQILSGAARNAIIGIQMDTAVTAHILDSGTSTVRIACSDDNRLDVSGPATIRDNLQVTGTTTVGTTGTSATYTFGQGTTGADTAEVAARCGNSGFTEARFALNRNGTNFSRWLYNGSDTYLDVTGAYYWRQGIGGTAMANLSSAGALTLASSITVGSLTSGKYPIASTGGLLINGPTPLAGTKVYYVSDTSGGAVTRKLTFVDGILTAET